jgi:hypothetical protein
MQSALTSLGIKSCRIWLRLSVHIAAMSRAPRAYIIATWWQVLGKRVRAHAQFAPLLATSGSAYRLWLLSEDMPDQGADADDQGPVITALVEAGTDSGRDLAQPGGRRRNNPCSSVAQPR